MNEATQCQSGEPSQASQAYKLIKAELLSCTIRPGARIVQRELAERYKLGLTPIREALQRLAQDGYLTPVPRMGYTVSTIRLRDLRELYDLRKILEGAAARWAAERATTEQLAKIQELAQRTDVVADRASYVHFLEHNAEFHQAVARASGNARLTEAIARLLDDQLRVFHLGLDLRDSVPEMRNEHIDLARALSDRDPARAERLVIAQIRRSRERNEEALIGGAVQLLQGLDWS